MARRKAELPPAEMTHKVPRDQLNVLPPRESASTELAKHLLEYLLSGAIEPGSRIPSERQLMETLQTGRSSIREALKSLTLLGLVEPRPGDGTYLVGSTSDFLPRVVEWGLLLGERSLRDLVETRTFLEVNLAGLAAERRTEADLATMQSHLSDMRAAATDLPTYIDRDIKFHLAIAHASGNVVMANMLASVRSLLQVWTTRVIEGMGRTDFSIAVHEPIYTAIAAQDVAGAQAAMTAHMDSAKKHLKQVLEGQPNAE